MSLDNFDDPWSAEHWTCQDCGAPLSEIVDGPGATLCFSCRNPAQAVSVFPLVCEECGQSAQVRILTSKGMLCMVCGDQVLEVQRQRALRQAGRESKRFRESILRSRHIEKEAVK